MEKLSEVFNKTIASQPGFEDLKIYNDDYEKATQDPDFDNKCDAWREKEEEFDRRR